MSAWDLFLRDWDKIIFCALWITAAMMLVLYAAFGRK